MKKILLILLTFVALKAEFIDDFENIPPAKEIILGEEVIDPSPTIDSTPIYQEAQPQTYPSNPQTKTYQEETIQQNSYPKEIIIQESEIIIDDTVNDQNNQPQTIDTQIEQIVQYREVEVEDFLDYGPIKIALLVPKKVIKGYAKKVSNSILSYLIFRYENFTFEVFDSKDEKMPNLLKTISKIKAKGYKYVIAPLTKKGASTLAALEKDILIYIPTVHKSQLNIPNGNFYFGGIDYKKQIKKLLKYANSKIVVFMDRSYLAQLLTGYIQQLAYAPVYVKTISNAKINPKYILKNNQRLNGASIFFNMPLVSTALLASSFSSFSIKPYRLFSTQVNYSPLLFSMIQKKDRQNFYLANSIGYINSKLDDINQNLGIKIRYDWVAYSSSIAIDYLISNYYKKEPLFTEDMINHQIKYRIKIEKIKNDEFVRVR